MALQLKDTAPTDGGPLVVVTAKGFRHVLGPGDTVEFGRGGDQGVRLGHDPEDLRVPRSAGRIECREGDVLVHNVSQKKSLSVRTFAGPVLEIPPGTVLGASFPVIQLVVRGGSAREYAVNVDARALPAVFAGLAVGADGATIGYDRVTALTDRERDLLLALCLPVVSGSVRHGEAPSYGEMEQILLERGRDVAARRVRKGLDLLRRRLAEQHDVEGLLGDETDSAGGKQSFLPALAQWALASGTISPAEVDRFDQDESDTR